MHHIDDGNQRIVYVLFFKSDEAPFELEAFPAFVSTNEAETDPRSTCARTTDERGTMGVSDSGAPVQPAAIQASSASRRRWGECDRGFVPTRLVRQKIALP